MLFPLQNGSDSWKNLTDCHPCLIWQRTGFMAPFNDGVLKVIEQCHRRTIRLSWEEADDLFSTCSQCWELTIWWFAHNTAHQCWAVSKACGKQWWLIPHIDWFYWNFQDGSWQSRGLLSGLMLLFACFIALPGRTRLCFVRANGISRVWMRFLMVTLEQSQSAIHANPLKRLLLKSESQEFVLKILSFCQDSPCFM